MSALSMIPIKNDNILIYVGHICVPYLFDQIIGKIRRVNHKQDISNNYISYLFKNLFPNICVFISG